MAYDNLTPFERKLAQFGDSVAIIAGLDLNNKITADEAFERVKVLYKQLKAEYKARGIE